MCTCPVYIQAHVLTSQSRRTIPHHENFYNLVTFISDPQYYEINKMLFMLALTQYSSHLFVIALLKYSQLKLHCVQNAATSSTLSASGGIQSCMSPLLEGTVAMALGWTVGLVVISLPVNKYNAGTMRREERGHIQKACMCPLSSCLVIPLLYQVSQ